MSKFIEDLVEFVDKQLTEFNDITNKFAQEAIDFHRSKCENPPDNPCEETFLRLYREIWQSREIARKIANGEVQIVVMGQHSHEEVLQERGNGGYV